MKIYTRTGDEGETSLVGGTRVKKTCLRLEAYGTVDELNSQLGWLLCEIRDEMGRKCIVGCQRMLFEIGARLASPSEADVTTPLAPSEAEGEWVRGKGAVVQIEGFIDEMSSDLPKWKGFTLPGGCEASARAHVCRTVCRRTERQILRLNEVEPVPEWILKYMNRLSDLLYVLALRENFLAGKEEILWKKSL